MFITTESVKSFKFTREYLINLYFYYCLQLSLICGDFSKGLKAAVIAQAAKDLVKDIKDNNSFIGINNIINTLEAEYNSEFLKETIIINITIGIKGERTYLQLCEQYTIKAIKKRLINSSRYLKETWEVLVDLLNNQVKAPTLEALKEAQKKLLSRLCLQEREYL